MWTSDDTVTAWIVRAPGRSLVREPLGAAMPIKRSGLQCVVAGLLTRGFWGHTTVQCPIALPPESACPARRLISIIQTGLRKVPRFVPAQVV